MDDAPLRPLLALMRKRGLGLGGLTVEQQALVWALVWAGLPDGGMTEPQVNEALKSQLAGAACFVDTDHVELRRWLVDAGWLRRDGFGREYRRTPLAELPTTVNAGHDTALILAQMPVAQWAAEQHAAHDAQRTARRLAWAQQQADKP